MLKSWGGGGGMLSFHTFMNNSSTLIVDSPCVAPYKDRYEVRLLVYYDMSAIVIVRDRP